MLTYPEIDPVLIQIGPLAIRWYALAYVAGILLGWGYINRLISLYQHSVTKKYVEDFVNWAIFGILIGGRLGYVVFYKAGYYLFNPLEALMIWHGGMSFHGGMIGVVVAAYLFAKSRGIKFFHLQDLIAAAAPIGLFFGRLANFVNGELYGRITLGPMGMIFPNTEGLPRHPSQLYEAALEGLVLFVVLYALIRFRNALKTPGVLSASFLIGYGASRFIVEFFREPDAHLGFVFGAFSMGQLLSLPMIALGVYVLRRVRRAAS